MFVADGNLLAQTPSAISVVDIQFKKTICIISEGSGSPTLMEESQLLSGFLETRPLDLSIGERGTTKDVFGVSLHSIPWRVYLMRSLPSYELAPYPMSPRSWSISVTADRKKSPSQKLSRFLPQILFESSAWLTSRRSSKPLLLSRE